MEDFTENLFLASLDPRDRADLARSLRPSKLALGQIMVEQGEPVELAIFPIRAQLANVLHLQDGGTVEIALVGREGLGGLAPIMSERPCAWQIVVRAEGDALVGPASAVRRLQESSPAFMTRLLELTQFYQEQAAHLGACNTYHRLVAKLARWLLTASDMSPSSTLLFTHDELASLLGCQRTSVTEAARTLQALGGIDYRRGQIHIVDRRVVESASCECYFTLRARAEALNAVAPS